MNHAIDRLSTDPATQQTLRAMAERLAAAALEVSTPERMHRAQTRRAAAAHEAGHAVVYVCEGIAVRSVRVWRSQGVWLGETREATPWRLVPDMGAAAYLRRARGHLAGWCGEAAAGCDVVGSSMDEIVISQALAQSAAALLGADPRELWLAKVLNTTMGLLDQQAGPHRRLIGALLRQRRLTGPRLAALLRGVGGDRP